MYHGPILIIFESFLSLFRNGYFFLNNPVVYPGNTELFTGAKTAKFWPINQILFPHLWKTIFRRSCRLLRKLDDHDWRHDVRSTFGTIDLVEKQIYQTVFSIDNEYLDKSPSWHYWSDFLQSCYLNTLWSSNRVSETKKNRVIGWFLSQDLTILLSVESIVSPGRLVFTEVGEKSIGLLLKQVS